MFERFKMALKIKDTKKVHQLRELRRAKEKTMYKDIRLENSTKKHTIKTYSSKQEHSQSIRL